MYSDFMLRRNMKLMLPMTMPFPVSFSSKKWHQRWKCGAMPRKASQRWMKVAMIVAELGARCTNSIW
jgi:hypothetical protein